MRFRTVAVVTAAVTLLLAVGYLLAGALVVGRWQIEPTASVLLLGRRMGALYLGLSVIFFLARNAPASPVRRALCTGAVVTCALLACLGLYEYLADRVSAGILASVAIEALLVLAYIRLLATEGRGTAAS